MSVQQTGGAFETAAELSDDPDFQRLFSALSETVYALGQELQAQGQRLKKMEDTLRHISDAVSRLR